MFTWAPDWVAQDAHERAGIPAFILIGINKESKYLFRTISKPGTKSHLQSHEAAYLRPHDLFIARFDVTSRRDRVTVTRASMTSPVCLHLLLLKITKNHPPPLPSATQGSQIR